MKNQYKFKYQPVFSAKFDKQDQDEKMLDETELYINLNVNHDFTETDLDNLNVRFSSEEQIRRQELKDFGWRFDNINSMKINFYKTEEKNGSSSVTISLRS